MERPAPGTAWACLGGLALLAIACPLVGLLLTPNSSLLGYSGVGRGEFENWAWSDWWFGHYMTCFPTWREQVIAFFTWPRDFDFGNYLDGWLITQPLKLALGPVAGHNMRVGVVLGLNAAAAWTVCRQALRLLGRDDPVTALIGAVALACNPITLWDISESRFGQALIATWLAYLAALLAWTREPSLRTSLWCGFWLAATALQYWFASLFVLPFAVLALASRPSSWRAWGLHGVLGVGLCVPFALPFVLSDRPTPALGTAFPALSTLDVRGPEVLGPPGPALTVAHSVDLAHPLAPPGGPSLPWIWLLVGAAAFHLWPRRLAVGLASSAVVAWLFALGPYCRWGGTPLADGLLFDAAYRWLPLVWRLYWPSRVLPYMFAALVLLSLPAVDEAVRRMGRSAVLLAVAAMLPAFLDGGCPLPVTPLQVPLAYRDGRMKSAEGGIFEASLGFNSGCVNWYQTWHGLPVLGNLGYCPPRYRDWPPRWTRDDAQLRANGLIRFIEQSRQGEAAIWSEDGKNQLREAGFRWVVVQRVYGGRPIGGADRVESGLRRALGTPQIDDPDMVAWHL